MTKYHVRSRELIDLVNEIKTKRLILSPHFQRNLVWRLSHKIDFIKTILLEYPFPQIFIAKGDIDLETMTTTSFIVDGQQRMNAITEYIKGEFVVDGVKFSELSPVVKENFLKYQIPIIDLELNSDDPAILEIFQRLNRTFYALSGIEKTSTEFASSELMLFAKYLVKELEFENLEEEYPLQFNPNLSETFISWTKDNQLKFFNEFILEQGIFTPYELTRQVHLRYTLNIISTVLDGYYNRNEFVDKNLKKYIEDFTEKDNIFKLLEDSAHKFIKIKFKKKSYWLNKANAFSLITFFARNWESVKSLDEKIIREKLENFEKELPEDYRIAAKEGVNNKKERLIRDQFITNLFIGKQLN